jgi:ribose transport system substrate-binding protein
MTGMLTRAARWAALAAVVVGGSLGGATMMPRAHAATKPTIVLATINLQALFFNQMNAGAKKAAAQVGANLVIFNANNDQAAENSAIEDYVNQKVAALIVDAIDVHGILPALAVARKAHIPVIAVDAVLDPKAINVQVGVDNGAAGAQMGQFFNAYVKKNMGGKVNLGVVGALNSFIQLQRQNGFLGVAKTLPGFKLAGIVDGRNVQDTALTAAENLVTGNPAMNAIYATGEPALIGVVSAIRSQGTGGRIKVFGWDLSSEAIQGIDAGYVVAVVQQDPYTEGVQAVRAAMTLSKGGKMAKQISVPITIVTKANVNPYRAQFKAK